ncbi:hypothetical protein QR680_013947 [Steinernema hermaphroditum]|uniref:ShKT domain-containing protein n=1 Tax=Steinernema hermaphroditum TaxID=289476 RepID=A0AA39M381_9BILA|nr:hypothetical protein QR680_013947 [Steinernema hermaphroditum]
MFRFVLCATFLAVCAATCVDKYPSECAAKAWSCYSADPGYSQWIRYEMCPYTCGTCTGNNDGNGNSGNGNGNGANGNGGSVNCVDSGEVSCTQEWCNSIYVTDAQKKYYCAKTCGRC